MPADTTSSRFAGSSGRAKNYTTPITTRVPDDLLERLVVVSEVEHLGMADTIRLVLERGLAVKPKGKRP